MNSNQMFELRGAYTALITPFKDGAVDFAALHELVERQIAGGIDGLVPCGTTGEAATMSDAECLDVISAVIEVADGRVPIIAGTGSNDTAKSLRFTQRVADLGGVDAALVVTPYYNKPNQRAMIRHFTEIANSGGLPVVLYNVPGRTAVSMTAETVAELSNHPKIIAVKEATGDMILATRIRELADPSFALASGDDFTTYPLLAVGGTACISVVSNLLPGTMSAMCTAANEGRWSTARELHYAIQPLARALFSDSNPVPVKAAANLLGWCGPDLRAPLYAAGPELRERLSEVLQQYEFEQ